MLEETVVREMVKPTDWAFTSQNDASLPQVFDRGRKPSVAADMVQRRFAAVAVSNRAVGQVNFKIVLRVRYAWTYSWEYSE